jgi:membrane-bound inhibitor of C-type lysozyme
MANITRIKTNQISDGNVTAAKIASGTLVGSLFAPTLSLNSNVTIIGNLTISGNSSTINSVNTYIQDPIVVFNNGYSGSMAGYDVGVLVNRNFSALGPYGAVNTAWVWVENDQAFEAIATTTTGNALTTLNTIGFANLKVGNIIATSLTSSGTISGPVSATTLNATSAGVGTMVVTNFSSGNITGTFNGTFAGTISTANVAMYANVTALTTNQTFYPIFSNTSSTGNTIHGVASTISVNPSTGNVSATNFVGSGQYLTNLPVPSGNVAYYGNIVGIPTTTNQTFYLMFANAATASNSTFNVDTTLFYNPLSGNLNLVGGNLIVSNGNAWIGQLYIGGTDGATITSNTGKINLGTISNLTVAGGTNGYAATTNGSGVLNFSAANAIVLGSNATGAFVSNATTLTSTTNISDALALLNSVLGKLVPTSPPTFPGGTALTLTAPAAVTGLMTTGWTQPDNSIGNTYQVAPSTSISTYRAQTYTTSTITAVGPGDQGTVRVFLNNVIVGSNTLVGGSGANTSGNLSIANNTDYHNVVASVAAGFWYSFNASATGGASSVPTGWNTVLINDTYTASNTNPILWYVDTSAPGTPTFSNTSLSLLTNSVIYSSTIPHFTSGANFKLRGNVNNLAGDTYLAGMATNLTSATSSNATAFVAPTTIAWNSGVIGPYGPTVAAPLTRNFCANGTSVFFETTSAIVTTGFGSGTSTTGPILTVNNNYNSGASGTNGSGFVPGVTILYKTGTTTPIDETTIATTTPIGAVSGGSYRVVYSQATDTPTAVTGSETVWSSAAVASGGTPLGLMDATVVGSGTGGRIQYDVTNYSTGYLPVGPNLTGQNTTQYFTMRFAQSGVSSFFLNYTGTVANIFCAMPTSGGVGGTNATNVSNATYNGWLSAGISNPGGVPGPGSAGNGSAGCVTGAVPVFGSAVTSGTGSGKMNIYFGTTLSTGAVGNFIYIRFKLLAGHNISALSITAV